MKKRSRADVIQILALMLICVWAGGCGTAQPTERPLVRPSATVSVTKGSGQVEAGVRPTATEQAPTKTTVPALAEQPTVEPAVSATTEPESAQQPTEEGPAIAQAPDSPSLASDLVIKLEGLRLEDFFEVSWRELVLRNPEAVLEVGLTEIYGVTEVELTDISDAYVRETYRMYATVLEMLRSFDRATLPAEQQVSYDVYEWFLEDRVREQAFMYYDYPATYYPITAVHEQMIQFFTDIHPVTSQKDARDYVTRLGLVGVKFEQLLEGLRLREEAGIIPPRFAIQWALYGGLQDLAKSSPQHTPFYTALEGKLGALEGISVAEKQALLEDAEKAIDTVVLPAYQALVDYLSHLEPLASDKDGVWQFSGGQDYYAYLLRHYTTTALTPERIHELGLEELERIHAEMASIFGELGYPQDGGLPELFDRVAQDSGLISGNQVLETYEEIIAEAYQNLDVAFDIRPQAEVIVVPDQYGGFYVPGAIDGSRPGAFYAAVGGKGEEYYGMPTLAYHETIPGHHLQIGIAQELNLPSFRRGVGFTGFTEGWALYAEQLAVELGWYEGEPYGNLGRLQGEAFRAARLVVDTGIHAKGWDFDRALAFFVENVGFEPGDIVNPQHEIARYIVWPGQSVSYKIGMLKILELRQRVKDRLGDQFDLVAFHNVVLSNGEVPLEILERIVDGYIETELKGQ